MQEKDTNTHNFLITDKSSDDYSNKIQKLRIHVRITNKCSDKYLEQISF